MKFEHPPIIEINYSEFVKYIGNKEVMDFLNEADKRYFYWNEIKYRPNLPLENPIDVWTLVKINRSIKSRTLFFGNHQFTFNVTSYIQEDLHEFDLKLVGGLYKDSITPQDQDEFFKNSLIEEAIASSQIEGAATTTNIARDMIKSGRKPRTESEQMIFNNFYAIRAIEERLDEKLDKQLIIDIHSIMTNNTDASQYSGDFRKGPIYVKDHFDGEIAHTAPDWRKRPY